MVIRWQKIHLPVKETQVQSLGQEDPLEKEMATHSSTLAWRIPWTEKPAGLLSMGLRRVGCDLVTKQPQTTRLSYSFKGCPLPTFLLF